MAEVADISPEESIKQNLEQWCYEVGTHFEDKARKSAEYFTDFIGTEPVVDLGSGDGAATKFFVNNGNPTTAVDINPKKLAKVKGAKKVQKDFLAFLVKPVDNVFCHHALEHFVDYQAVLDAIGKHCKGYCFIAVPNNDPVHEVHHVRFTNVEELAPPGMEIVEATETKDELRVVCK